MLMADPCNLIKHGSTEHAPDIAWFATAGDSTILSVQKGARGTHG